jgi:hypothetical protein
VIKWWNETEELADGIRADILNIKGLQSLHQSDYVPFTLELNYSVIFYQIRRVFS